MGHLLQVAFDGLLRARVLDLVGVDVVQLADGPALLVAVAHRVVQHALVAGELRDDDLEQRVERVDVGLLDVVGSDLPALPIGALGGLGERPDRDAGIPGRHFGDLLEDARLQGAAFEGDLRAALEDLDEDVPRVAIELDALAARQPGDDPAIEAVQEVALAIADQDGVDVLQLRELVEDVLATIQLVGLVEDHDVGPTVGVADPPEELVVRCRVLLDVHRLADAFDQLQQRREATGVLPAVDVLHADVDERPAELPDGVARAGGLAGAGRPDDHRVIAAVAVEEWFEPAGEGVQFVVATEDFGGDGFDVQRSRVDDHLRVPSRRVIKKAGRKCRK